MNRRAAEDICENCKYWVASDAMIDWGVCGKNNSARQIRNRTVTGVLRRCDESCGHFKSADSM